RQRPHRRDRDVRRAGAPRRPLRGACQSPVHDDGSESRETGGSVGGDLTRRTGRCCLDRDKLRHQVKGRHVSFIWLRSSRLAPLAAIDSKLLSSSMNKSQKLCPRRSLIASMTCFSSAVSRFPFHSVSASATTSSSSEHGI